MVPAENLLEYKMGEGWKPLCDFLEVPVPEGRKFPRTNDTDGFVDRCRRRNRMQMLNVALRAAVERVVAVLAVDVVLGVSAGDVVGLGGAVDVFDVGLDVVG